MPASITALLPLRGGSKGIPGKNVRLFNGQPLFSWSATAVIEAGLPLVISTEDEAIKDSVSIHTPTAQILDRPSELASDSASTEVVIEHFFASIPCEHCLLIQATSPLTGRHHLLRAVQAYQEGGCRPLVSGVRRHTFHWGDDGYPLNYNPAQRPRRQDWIGTFVENGAFYIFSRSDFLRTNSRCPPPCTLFEMEDIHGFEIDSELDWSVLEQLSS